jgi:hypothetical protein
MFSNKHLLTLNGCLFRNVSLSKHYITCKHFKKFLNVFGKHFIFMNRVFSKEEGYIIYL